MRKEGSVVLWILITVGVLVATFFLLIGALVVVYLFVGQPNQVRGVSMEPNYHDGEYILTNKVDYRTAAPKRGDVVIYQSPENADIDFIGRIVGLPGETMKISGGKVYIQGVVVDESKYVRGGVYTGPEKFLAEDREFIVPQGEYFILGDNRTHAADSRERGPIPGENIIGRVDFCYWHCSANSN